MIATSIEDLRATARRRVPRAIFDYIDGGSYAELTMRRNRDDLDALLLRQKVMVDVGARSTATDILGTKASMPAVIAPTGLAGFVHKDGEIRTARAAAAFGIPYCLSTVSICSIEDVRAVVDVPFWFQLYVLRDRGVTRALIERALAAGCPALVVTVDTQVQGRRRRDIRNGLTVPPRLTICNAVDVLSRPAWALGVLMGKRRTFGNLAGLVDDLDIASLGQWVQRQFEASLTWKDLDWVRREWPRKLVIKGTLTPEDARHAADVGAEAIVVSNHGGRQLDGARSSISALPGIVDAVAGRTEVLFDGGIRSGQDMLKAVALGASACLMGRAPLYGLAAGGERGVSAVLDMLRQEMDTSMALCGCSSVAEIAQHVLDRGEPWHARSSEQRLAVVGDDAS